MPKKAASTQEKLNREFLAALRGGQARMGDKDSDTARYMPNCRSTYYQRLRSPQKFTLEDIRILSQQYHFTDHQACQFLGIEYHGSTPA